MKGKLQEKVVASKEAAFMSKLLATIDINADIGFELGDLQFNFPLPESARKMLIELEFATVLKKDIFSITNEETKIENTQKIENWKIIFHGLMQKKWALMLKKS